jgi:hypothetical protein
MDDFSELMLGAVGLCYYARINDDPELFAESRRTLKNLLDVQDILFRLVYGIVKDNAKRERVISKIGPKSFYEQLGQSIRIYYRGAVFARMFGLNSPLADLNGFMEGENEISRMENLLKLGDTPYWELITDEQIKSRIETYLASRESWTQLRYKDRFGDNPPVRRTVDGYECIGAHGNWKSAENPHHVEFKEYLLWFDAPLAVFSPQTLNCEWARLGCAPADFDNSLEVNDADMTIFESLRASYGDGAPCDYSNSNCKGADLDRDGKLDSDDIAYMNAAKGCKR